MGGLKGYRAGHLVAEKGFFKGTVSCDLISQELRQNFDFDVHCENSTTHLVDMSLMGATSSFCSFIFGWSLKTISTSEAAPDPPAPEASASESVIGIGFSFFFFFGGGA